MSSRSRYSYVSLQPAEGWSAAVRGTELRPYLSVVPDAGDVELGVTVRGADSLNVPADSWIRHVAELNRRKRREVFAAACGDFSGYSVQFEKDHEWCRGWVLHSAKWPLVANYQCPKEIRGRDDDVVSWMLASLKLVVDS